MVLDTREAAGGITQRYYVWHAWADAKVIV
jgi:hypothetical protein